MKHELRQAAFLCEELDRGNVCPACPKVCIQFCHFRILLAVHK